MKMTENKLQIEVIKYLNLVATKYDIMFWHIPNGGYRNPREAANFKRMGVLPGIPDIQIISYPPTSLPCNYYTFFIELKVGKNKTTQIQKDVQMKLNDFGINTYTCWSLDEVIHALRMEGISIE